MKPKQDWRLILANIERIPHQKPPIPKPKIKPVAPNLPGRDVIIEAEERWESQREMTPLMGNKQRGFI